MFGMLEDTSVYGKSRKHTEICWSAVIMCTEESCGGGNSTSGKQNIALMSRLFSFVILTVNECHCSHVFCNLIPKEIEKAGNMKNDR